MARGNLDDLAAFVAVARERSFTRAAAKLGVSSSALSQTMRQLEARLGVRLLTRTTRSVTPTEAGGSLLAAIAPMLDGIEAQVEALSELKDRPAGTIRISADEVATEWLLWPALRKILPDYPEIKVEIDEDSRLKDIVAEGFDAGVRQGGMIAKDMIAIPIGPDLEVAVVGSDEYFAGRPRPATPHDLPAHNCINLRLPTLGGLYVWEFEKDGRELRVRVDGQLTFNTVRRLVQACVDGFGLAYVPKHLIQDHLDSGALAQVLEEWSPPWPGHQLYYPSTRQPTAAFTVLAAALRYRR